MNRPAYLAFTVVLGLVVWLAFAAQHHAQEAEDAYHRGFQAAAQSLTCEVRP